MLFSAAAVRTAVYIDGFNLYFRCLKGTPYRWLDLRAFASRIAPKNATIINVRYFTARVMVLPGHDQKDPAHQEFYLRALGTLHPDVSIHYGEYRAHSKRLPLHPRPAAPPYHANVLKSDEKGSDVNLAAHLLLDGFKRGYDQALVISNDSDLATPIQMVRDDLKLRIGVIFPSLNKKQNPTAKLRNAASYWNRVRESALKQSQFLNHLTDAKGQFSKPPSW